MFFAYFAFALTLAAGPIAKDERDPIPQDELPSSGLERSEDGLDESRCLALVGPAAQRERHRRWRVAHLLDVDYSSTTWELSLLGTTPTDVRRGDLKELELVDVVGVRTDAEAGGPGSVRWIAVVELDGKLAELCDRSRVTLRLDDALGTGAQVIALHPAGILLREHDDELVFVSAEDAEQAPDVEWSYHSTFELVEQTRKGKPKPKRKKKKKKKKKRGRRR